MREKGEGKRTLDDDGGERAHASERLRCYNSEKELSVNVLGPKLLLAMGCVKFNN